MRLSRDPAMKAALVEELRDLRETDPRDLGFEDYEEGLRAVEARMCEIENRLDEEAPGWRD